MLAGLLRYEPHDAGDVGHADRVPRAVGAFDFDRDADVRSCGRSEREPDFMPHRGGQPLDARLLRHQQEDTGRDRKHAR